MPVGATFEPQAKPDETVRNAIDLLGTQQSLMQRATQAKQMERMRELQIAQEEFMQPIKRATAQAELFNVGQQYDAALQTQQTRKQAYEMLPAARKEFDSLISIQEPERRETAALDWAARYSQLANIQEIAPEWGAKLNIAAKMSVEAQAIRKMRENVMSARLKNQYAPPGSPLGKMLQDLERATAEGKEDEAKYLKTAIEQEITPKGMQLEIGPEGTIRFFQGAGGLTTQNTTKSQEREYQQERLIREGAQLTRLLTPEDLGLQGVLRENLGGLLGQIDPKLAETQVAENRSRLRAYREGALRAVSDDARFSNKDREAIEKMFPSDSWIENLPQAKAKLRTAVAIFAQRASAESARRGQKSITDLSPEELVAQARDGKIDKDVAAALLDALHADWLKAQTKK